MSKKFELREGQKQAISLIDQGKNVLCVFPTGYGKTIVGKEAVRRSIKNNKLAFFVSPLRALSNQLYEELKEDGVKTLLDVGDNRCEKIEKYNSFEAVITTYERLDSILRSSKKNKITKKIGYVVIDEIHNLGSKNRGESVYSTIRKLIYHFTSVKFVGLSATINNMNYVSKEIRAEIVYIPPEQRPIPLKKIYKIFPAGKRLDEVHSKIELVRDIIGNNEGQCLVLCGSRKLTEKLAKLFKRDYKISAGYHHAKLQFNKRKEVESNYKKGKTRVLFCTTTLSQGLNLPGDFVITFDYKFWNNLLSKYIFMERMILDQFIGRAGRPGMTKGNVANAYFLVSNEDESTVKQIMSDDIIIKKQNDCKSLVCDWLTSGIHDDIQDLVIDLRTEAEIKPKQLVESINWLKENKLITVDSYDNVYPTRDAQISAWFFVHPTIVVALKKLEDEEFKNELDLLSKFITYIPEYDELVRYDSENRNDRVAVSKVAEKYSDYQDDLVCLKTFYYLFYNSFERKPNTNVIFESGSISNILNRFIAVGQIVIVRNDIKLLLQNIDQMIKLHKILTPNQLKLIKLPNIGKKRLQILIDYNIDDINKLINKDSEQLSKLIGLKVMMIEKIKKAARNMI